MAFQIVLRYAAWKSSFAGTAPRRPWKLIALYSVTIIGLSGKAASWVRKFFAAGLLARSSR